MNTYDFDKTIFYPDSSASFYRYYGRPVRPVCTPAASGANTVSTVDGKKVTPVQKGEYYYVPISNVVAVDLDKNFHVEVSTAASGVIAEIDYCALSYAYKQLKAGEESELVDLIRALVLYNREADSYFGG